MKKLIFLTFAAAAVALVACNKTEFTGPEAEGEQPVSFRIAVNNLTKADAPFTETDPSSADGGIPIVSSSHYGDGTTIAAKTEFEYLRYLGEFWYLADANFSTVSTFPLGDTRMDVLAFLGYNNNYDVEYIRHPFHFETTDGGRLTGDYLTAYEKGWENLGDALWRPVLTDNTNYANKAYFINVVTPQYNYDIMYGSANEIKKGDTRTLTLKHAMAALYFNIAFADPDDIPDGVAMDPPLFIKPGNPGDDFYDALVHCDYGTYNTVDGELSNDYLSGEYYYNYLSLKTVGTFIVDNSKNNLEASWYLGNWNLLDKNYWETYYSASGYAGEGYAYLQNKDVSEEINTVSNREDLYFSKDLNDYGFLQDTYYRVAAQLVPEQEIVNPWLRYRIGNHIYLTEVNLPRGTWQMGHAYIYNLKLNFNGVKFNVTVKPYEYLTGGHYLEY